jgi:hypothetical protein
MVMLPWVRDNDTPLKFKDARRLRGLGWKAARPLACLKHALRTGRLVRRSL